MDPDIIRGVVRRVPALDVWEVRESGLRSAQDPIILEYAASAGRVLVTRDAETMIKHAYDRVRAGLPMPGVILVPQSTSIGGAINALVTIVASDPAGVENRVLHIRASA